MSEVFCDPIQDPEFQSRSTLDPRVRRYVMPTRILWQTEGPQCGVDNAQALLEDRSDQITLGAHAPCVLKNQGKAPGLLLDFGRELHGGLQIMVWGAGARKRTARLRVRFGESAAEAMSDLGGDKNATNDHAVRDLVTDVSFLSMHEVGMTGFRFVRLDLVDENSSVELKSVRAIFVYRDLEYRGAFRCSDERLNRIWSTGAYTVHLNMQDYLWDGIKRDRLVWLGDMHPEVSTIRAVFGDTPIVPASLDLIRDETPLPGWMNGIPSYSLWWILIHRNWYAHHARVEYLNEQKDYLTQLLAQVLRCVNSEGVEHMPETRFLDWPTSGNAPAIHAGLQSLMIMALEAGAVLTSVLGDKALCDRCLSGAALMRRHIPDPSGSKQAGALMVLAGLSNPMEMNRELLSVDGARRLSTFYGYYVLQARAKAGDVQGCLDNIREYWGAMLDLGATSFWEDFNLDWMENAGRIDELVPEGKRDVHGDYGDYCYKGYRHSLCHGWASGPTAWMSEHVLGFKVLEPGCAQVAVRPVLGDLEWAEGAFPTPQGPIRVRHVRNKDRIESEIDAPSGVRIKRQEKE